MNTKEILLISTDKDLISLIKVSALTLTKLNCQVSVKQTNDFNTTFAEAQKSNLDMIILDLDNGLDRQEFNFLKLISELRQNADSKSKKIISLFENQIPDSAEKIYSAGCDSIMKKSEFKKAVNNILQF